MLTSLLLYVSRKVVTSTTISDMVDLPPSFLFHSPSASFSCSLLFLFSFLFLFSLFSFLFSHFLHLSLSLSLFFIPSSSIPTPSGNIAFHYLFSSSPLLPYSSSPLLLFTSSLPSFSSPP